MNQSSVVVLLSRMKLFATVTINCALMACAEIPITSAGSADHTPGVTLTKCLESYNRNFGKVNGLRVMYQAMEENGLSQENVVEVELAVKGPSRLISRMHGKLGGVEQSHPSDGVSYYDEKSFNVFRPHFRRYETSHRFAAPPYTDKIRTNFFLDSIAWWPHGDRTAPPAVSGYSFFLKDVLANSKYRVHSRVEVDDGVECCLLELPGVDRLWFDFERGVLLKRELLHARSRGVEVAATIWLSDYRHVEPGVWLPFSIRRQVGLASRSNVIHVRECSVNTISDEFFKCILPPGTLVYNRDNDEAHQVPGGLDFLDVCIDRGIHHIKNTDSTAVRGEASLSAWSILGAAVYLFIWIIFRYLGDGAAA